MDFAVAQLALIFLPGIVWANIDRKYGSGLKPDQVTFLLRAFLFGMTTYSTLYLIYSIFGVQFGDEALAADMSKVNIFELKDEIAWSLPLSFMLSIFWLWGVKYRIFMKFLHLIKASRRYGDEDVWSFTLNSGTPHVEYVHVRDLENGYVFAGWVNTFSEDEDSRELLLRDAIVYTEEGDEVSKPKHLYISRPKHQLWVEFPYREEGDSNG